MCAYVQSRFSCVQLLVILWTAAPQPPLSMEFSRQEYWSGSPCPPPGDFPYPGTEPMSLMFPALAGRFFTTSTNWEAPFNGQLHINNFLYICIIYTSYFYIFTTLKSFKFIDINLFQFYLH